jgi:hypothetical protein
MVFDTTMIQVQQQATDRHNMHVDLFLGLEA